MPMLRWRTTELRCGALELLGEQPAYLFWIRADDDTFAVRGRQY